LAFAYSGGGVRAFISAIGFTRAAIELGLYDCVTWSGGVSGGAWFECLWTQFNGDFADFRDHMRKAFSGQPFVQGPKALRAIYRVLLLTFAPSTRRMLIPFRTLTHERNRQQ
jgi:hypothetical protein